MSVNNKKRCTVGKRHTWSYEQTVIQQDAVGLFRRAMYRCPCGATKYKGLGHANQ